MMEWLKHAICVLVGHDFDLFDSCLYGPVLICTRCMDSFEYAPGNEHDG